MRLLQSLCTLLLVVNSSVAFAVEGYKPGPDSQPQAGVPRGELIKEHYVAKDGSVFPGTERDYTIYLPPGLDKSRPSAFMVFQDGVIYNAPVVFDNLIAKKQIPPLIGIFIRPGVVPAANASALPRFNRSYEYDSVTDTYARFLIDEFLPAITKKHGLNLSEKGDDAAISGNSSGGICAFMVAWHRPDRFRRVFTGVGTYVGIHGADQLPVLIRKIKPKPLRVYLQSGTSDNNLYCGDWWMANQTMERSLTWAGYDVNHTWGEGGHNAKHATAIFPEVLKWLWRGWPAEGLRANPGNTSKWLGYGVIGDGGWDVAASAEKLNPERADYFWGPDPRPINLLAANMQGEIFTCDLMHSNIVKIGLDGSVTTAAKNLPGVTAMAMAPDGRLWISQRETRKEGSAGDQLLALEAPGKIVPVIRDLRLPIRSMCLSQSGVCHVSNDEGTLAQTPGIWMIKDGVKQPLTGGHTLAERQPLSSRPKCVALSPDQSLLYVTDTGTSYVRSYQIRTNGSVAVGQLYDQLQIWDDDDAGAEGLCVDAEGRLYVATALGIQVCDQAGRVNFIIPTPQQAHDVCFGGKDLGELFIACGDKIYKRAMKVQGVVSGQMAPIQPKAPHL